MKAFVSAPAVGSTPDFRRLLQAELARRCARNRRYSLRAFAQNLGVDHSTLSQLLRGRRRITAVAVRRLGAKLGLNQDEIGEYIAGLSPAGTPSGADPPVRQLTRDLGAAIADWHHFAILELVRLRDFVPDTRWIARVLGTSVDAVNVAVQQLLRLGLLRMESRSRWVDLAGDAIVNREALADAALGKALERAGRFHTTRARPPIHHGSITFVATAEQLALLVKRLDRLSAEVAGLVQARAGDRLYRLDVELHSLTEDKTEGSWADR